MGKLKRNWPIALLLIALVVGMALPLVLNLGAPGFYVEVLLGGLMSGVLYSLVALGFVLIFKASGVFNFAQGAMVLFAALAMARLAEWIPQLLGIESRLLGNLLAFCAALAVMVLFAWLVERLVLRHLVNQEGVVLLMATLGITYFIDGVGQTIWGSDIYEIKLGLLVSNGDEIRRGFREIARRLRLEQSLVCGLYFGQKPRRCRHRFNVLAGLFRVEPCRGETNHDRRGQIAKCHEILPLGVTEEDGIRMRSLSRGEADFESAKRARLT